MPESRSGSRVADLVFGGFWVMLCLATIGVGGPWAGFHGILVAFAGLLMVLCRPLVALPRSWWLLAALFAAASGACFLPAAWFPQPDWRRQLEDLGLATGPRVVIQTRQALEMLWLLVITLVTGMWLAGHRVSPSQLRRWALAFTLGVAAYAVLAKLQQNQLLAGQAAVDAHFGFFPNRNHSATYLAMGAVCGLGCVLQAIRDKSFGVLALALAATIVCLWALIGWSVSRAGVVLLAIGCLAWLPMLGRRYLGKHGLWAIGLIGLAVTGLFFIADSKVKQRLTQTVEKATSVMGSELPDGGKPAAEPARELDFRIPTALDTLGLIRDFKWTGIGAGQFYHVFPQYRRLSATLNDSDHRHPESDWLWLAAETGLPAALALLALVMLAFRQSLVGILHGRERALRAGCLVAAMLVPFHGIFDVPGHRITLAWSAALLFALSLHAPSAATPQLRAPAVWTFRLAALLLLATAGFLIRAQWWGGPQPALMAVDAVRDQALALYRRDLALQQLAAAQGGTHQPDPEEDLLEQALVLLNPVFKVAPLDRDLLRLQSSLALQFDDKFELAERAFALERALDPAWIAAPLRQAAALAEFRPATTADLWREALRRAERIEALTAGSGQSRQQVEQRILEQAKGKPALERLIPGILPGARIRQP